MPRRVKKFTTYDLLSDMEINSLTINQKVYNKKDNLYAWYRFEENISQAGDAKNSADAISGKILSPLSDAKRPRFTQLAPGNVPTVSGFPQHSYVFNNEVLKSDATDLFNFNEGPSTLKSAFSISAWFQFKSTGDDQYIVSKFNPGASNNAEKEYALYIDGAAGKIIWQIFSGSGANTHQLTLDANDLQIYPNRWYHVVATFSGTVANGTNDLQVFINGQRTSSTTSQVGAFDQILATNAKFSIGNHYNNASDTDFAGVIAQVAVWSTRLSSEDVQVLYNFRNTVLYEFRSGFVNLPPRITLRERDNTTGSYPTTLRVGTKDRKGNYKTHFNDQNVINFGKRIKDNFDLLFPIGNFGFSKTISDANWVVSQGMQIRTEVIDGPRINPPTALVFFSSFGTGARWIRTKRKIKNPRIRMKIIKGPYNAERDSLGFGLGLGAGAPTDVLKIQIDTNAGFTSPTTIKTIQNNDSLASASFVRSFTSPQFSRRKVIEVNLHPTDFPGNTAPFYLRIIQESVSKARLAVWAISEIEIDYHTESNLSFPLLVNLDDPVGQKIVSSSVASPHLHPTLIGAGRRISGISDSHLTFTPGESVSPFSDNSHFFNDSSVFFDQGTKLETVPGFSAPVSSKTIIDVDLSPSTETTFGLNTPGTQENSETPTFRRGTQKETDPTIKQNLMVYWNRELKRWEKITPGINGNAAIVGELSSAGVSPSLGRMIRSGSLGFSSIGMVSSGSSATLANQTIINQDGLLSYVRPTSTFGFPFEGKYEATSSQFIRAREIGITKPFLLEKCSLAFDAKFEFCSNQFESGSRSYSLTAARNTGGEPSGRTTCDNQKVYIPTFFILKQAKDKLESLIDYEVIAGSTRHPRRRSATIPDINPPGSSLVNVQNTRELITYGQMTLFVSGVANTGAANEQFGRGDTNAQVDIDELISNGLGRDLNVDVLSLNNQTSFNIANEQLKAVTGSFVMNFPCRISPIIKDSSMIFASYGEGGGGFAVRQPGSVSLGKSVPGRSAGDVSSNARSFVNGFGASQEGISFVHYNAQEGLDPVTVTPASSQFIDIASPYVIQPDDEIIFGWQYPVPLDMLNAAPGKSDNFFNTMTPFNNSTLRLIGSLVQDKKEFHEGLNQNLSSDAVHEIIGAEPVIDQFRLDKMTENIGNFYDTGISGSFLNIRGITPARRIGSQTFSKQEIVLGDTGRASASITFSTFRFDGKTSGLVDGDIIRLRDVAGTAYDFRAKTTPTDSKDFKLIGNASNYSDLLTTLFYLVGTINSTLAGDGSGNPAFDLLSGDVQVGLYLTDSLYIVTLNLRQRSIGVSGNRENEYIPNSHTTHDVNVSNFTGGGTENVLRANSYSRVVQLSDEKRIFTDSTGSTGAFFDPEGSSTFGLMNNIPGAAKSNMGPKYYFDSRTFGNFTDMLSQGLDSKFAERVNRREIRTRGAALQPPVRVTFVSGTNDNTTGVKTYTRKPPTLSQNKSLNSTLTGSFIDTQ